MSQFKLFHINIQSLSNKVDMLSLTLDKIQSDVACISEHWCCNDDLAHVNIRGYSLRSSYCRGAGLRGGVAIYVRDGMVYEEVTLTRFSIPFHAEFAGIACTDLDCLIIVGGIQIS